MEKLSSSSIIQPASNNLPVATSPRLMMLMFTDIVGSSDLKQRIGHAAYRAMKDRHDGFIKAALSAAPSGRAVQDTGDGFFLCFDSIAHSIQAALVFQWLMNQEQWPHPFSSRVGLHLGEVEEGRSSVTGQANFIASAIDIASRVMSLGQGGQILLTRAVFDAARQVVRGHPAPEPASTPPPLQWMAHGPYLFKGADEPMDVFEVGAESVAPMTAPADSEKAKRHIRPGDEMTLGWRPAIGRPLEHAPNWLLVEKLGEGGFGEVWLAEHAKTKATKVFKFCFDADRLRSLKREVVLFRLLKEALGDRPDIAGVKDWQFDHAPYFIELDYCPEGNLAMWAEAQGGIDKIILEPRIALVAQIAEALAAAHSIGILHKDIKPSNILMATAADRSFHPRLTDFGIGILTDRSRLKDFNITAMGFTASNLTMNDSSRTGTRMYTPPEGLQDKPHTVQGDVYAMGILLYQMAVGDLARPLAMGWEREISDPLLREDITAAVEGDPSRRFATASEFSQRLRSIGERRQAIEDERRANAEVDAVRQRTAELVRVAASRNRLLRASLTVVAMLAGLVIAFAFLLKQVQWQKQVAQDNLAKAVIAETGARKSEATARTTEEKARTSEVKARHNLAANWVSVGLGHQASGDPATALLYFTRALELEEDDPKLSLNERIRIQAAFAEVGRLVRPLEGDRSHPAIASEGDSDVAGDGRRLERKEHEVLILNRAGKPVTPPLKHEDNVHHASFSPDGTRVVTASQDKTARVWDAVTGQPLTPPLQHEERVWHAAFSPDGTQILTATDDGTARVWDAIAGLPLTPPLRHAHEVNHFYQPAFSRDGTRVVIGSDTAGVWEAASGRSLTSPLKHEGLVQDAAFSPDGTCVITASQDKTARVWDAASGRPLTPPLIHEAVVHHAAFSPHGTRVVTASFDGTARVWDAATGQPLTPPLKHEGGVYHAAFSPDGSRVVTASSDHTARVWDAVTGQPLAPPLKHEDNVHHAVFSPDGGRVVTASVDHTARVWDAVTGQPLTPPLKHEEGVYYAAFSLDGSRVVTASGDKTARVWDAVTGQPRTPPLKHENAVYYAAFSPDDTRIVTASGDKTARVWDAVTGQPLTPPLKHDETVYQAAFSPDSTRVVTASVDHTARVWDAATGQPLTPPLKHGRDVEHAAFSPDGTRIITASHDNTARVWIVGPATRPLADLIQHAELLAAHELNAVTGIAPLSPAEFQSRWDRLTTIDPRVFFPPPSPQLAETALTSKEMTPALLVEFGNWFEMRNQPAGAVKLLLAARQRGAAVDSTLLARCYWRTDDLPAAAGEFRRAMDKLDPIKDAAERKHLRNCLTAVTSDWAKAEAADRKTATATQPATQAPSAPSDKTTRRANGSL